VKKTRQRLIRATESLLQRDGLARVTTRGIAREAGVAEGALYHHFHDKGGLLHAVAQESMGAIREVLDSLPLQVGQRTVRENLEHMFEAAFNSQLKIAPILCSLFADHQLLVRTREILNERRIGPQRSVEALGAYLQAEQRLGRVAVDVAPRSAAELLLAGSFHAAMLDHLLARQVNPAAAHLRLQEAVRTLLTGLEPRISGESFAPKDRNAEP
jgi:AcrR family transcriptional regulator